jgi:uncharacterized protein HemX
MEKRRRSLMARLFPWLFVFALGVAAGYYVRDRRQHNEIQEAVQEARQDMERVGLEAIERARRASGDLRAGAEAAADSARAAFRELVGDAVRQP